MPWRDLTKFPLSTKLCNVYLIHFDRPFGHAQHYVGVTNGDPSERFKTHVGYPDVNLLKHAKAAGVQFQLARVWLQVPRYFEMKLKSRGKRPICPVCRAEARARRGNVSVDLDQHPHRQGCK